MSIPIRGEKRRSRSLIALAATALIAASSLVVPATASAAPAKDGADVTAATLDWGVRTSFVNYIGSPIAKGQIKILGAVTGSFTWSGGSGTAARDGSELSVGFPVGDGVHFQGHKTGDDYALDLAIKNARVEFVSASKAHLILDVDGRESAGMGVGEAFSLKNVVFGDVDLSGATASKAELTLSWTGAPVTLTDEGARAFAGFYSAGEKLDPLNLTVTLAKPAPERVWTPSLTAYLADGKTPVGNTPLYTGDTIVVKGADFDPASNVGGRGAPIPNTLPQGNYIVFGQFAQNWKPSTGAGSSERPVGQQVWALTEETVAQIPERYKAAVEKQWLPLTKDGTFSWRLTLAEPAGVVEGGQYGVYSYGAGGVDNATQELSVALNFQGERTTEPTPEPTEEPTPEPTEEPTPEPTEEPTPEPTEEPVETAPSVTINGSESKVTAQPGSDITFEVSGLEPGAKVRFDVHSTPVTVGTASADASGTARVVWSVPATFEPGEHTLYVYRVLADGSIEDAPLLSRGFSLELPVCEGPATTDTLNWGVRASFRNYVTGPIARGSVSTLGNVTKASDDAFVWTAPLSLAQGANIDVSFGAANGVRFRGHSMNGVDALDLALTNPRIEVVSAASATLYVDAKGLTFAGPNASGEVFENKDVAFATLELPQALASGDKRSWVNAKAILTAAGADAFGNFYSAGEELDPVSFSVTTVQDVDCTTPVDPETPLPEKPGPEEKPTPEKPLPEKPKPETPKEEKPVVGDEVCVARAVSGGSLTWVLKESFRSYVEGPIAKGSFSGGTFTATSGALNVEDGIKGRVNFSGAISAKGHNGLLNMSISSPTIVMTSATSGTLWAHVSSTDTSGKKVVDGSVAFASLSFPRATVNGGTVSVSGASVSLTAAGAKAFAGFYEAGTPLDSMSFSVRLGGEVGCDSSTGGAGGGALATTGSELPFVEIGAGVLALMAGLGLVIARRRRLS